MEVESGDARLERSGHFLPAASSWRLALLGALSLFLFTRVITLTSFPIFNDEAIYLHYAQLIHENWDQNKFVSMGPFYGDWKPPLQYWLAAPVIGFARDPLLAGRTVALIFSLAGFFGFYVFAKELFGEREAVVAAAFYAFCPAVLFHNNEFVAETFLFSTAPVLYWALLKAIRPGRWRWTWAFPAVAFGTALILFKQSGFLLLALSVFLPLGRFERDEGKNAASIGGWKWKRLVLNCSLVVVVILAAHYLSELAFPSAFEAARGKFNQRWVMTGKDLMRFPVDIWLANLKVVRDFIGAYYSWAVPILFGAFLFYACWKRCFSELALAFMVLAAAAGVTFLLRGFNEYIFNTAVIVMLLPLLARTAVTAWKFLPKTKNRWAPLSLLALVGAMLVHWVAQITLIKLSPAKYLERSTPWAVANYLESWSTGFGVKETVALLAKEKRTGVVFTDTQWGNPRTALELYGKNRFPQLRLISISREFLDPAETRKLRDLARRVGPVRLVIFSADPSGGRSQWQRNVESEMCEKRRTIRAVPEQMPIVICEF